MNSKLKEYWQKCDRFLIVMLAAGIVLRAIYLIEYSGYINFNVACGADVREYFDRAIEIISGRFFPEKPDIHGIFYPLVISPVLALTKSVAVVRTLQLILNTAAFAGLYYLLGKYNVSLLVRRIFLTFAMLYTVPFFHTAELISESLLIPLITVVMFMLYFMRSTKEKSALYAAFAGIFSGLTVLTHGSMLLLTVLYGAEIFREKRRKCALIFLLAAAVVTGAVVLGKSVHYGKFCFVQANGGFNFYLGNSPESDGTCRIRPGRNWRRLHLAAEKAAERRGISTDALFVGRSLKYMVEHPFRAAAGFGRKALLFFHSKELISGADPAGLVYRTYTVKSGKPFAFAIMILAVCGAVYAWKKHEKIPADMVVLFAAIFAVNVITVTSGRYRFPAYPSIYLFAAYAVALFPKKVTAAISVICILPVLGLSYGNKLDPESYRILGEAAYRKGDYDAAFRYFAPIRHNNDDPAGVQNMLGDIYFRKSDFKNSAASYRKAIELEPERYEAYMNLAKLVRNPEEAEKLYHSAFERGGEKSGICHVNYAKFLLSRRRAAEAVKIALQGTRLMPQNADAWNTLAVSYAYSGNIRLAMESFETASLLAPQHEGYRQNAQAMKQELRRRMRL